MKTSRRLLRLLAVPLLILAAAIAGLYFVRPGMDEYRALEVHAAPKPGALTATWLGVTALLLRDGEHAILIDPFFTRPPGLLNMVLDRAIAPDEAAIQRWLVHLGVHKLDAVLVSHSHFDHAMDAGVVARLTGAALLGSPSTLNIGRGSGVPETQLVAVQPGVAQHYGSFDITFVESRHAGATGGAPTGEIAQPLKPPAHYLDYKLGAAYSILIAHPQGRLLHHGSAGYVAGALKGYKADIAFLGAALVDDLDEYLHETVDTVGARRVMPTHWDDFTRPLDQPLLPMPLAVNLPKFFRGLRKRSDLSVQTLPFDEPVALFP